jgi:hypothetical protein
MPILARQVTPGRPGPDPPKHSIEDQPVVRPAATSTRTPVGQQRLQPGPFPVGQVMAIKHEEDLPHPLTVIHGTRPSVAGDGVGWNDTSTKPASASQAR